MAHPSKEMMRRAIDIAKKHHTDGGHAVAAIITKGDKIIAEAFTTIRRDNDPTCHAEMNAIRSAAHELHSPSLEGCYIYTTYEPCPMCASAIIWARISGVIFGAKMEDETPTHPQRIKIPCADIFAKGKPSVEIFSEFMRDECRKLLDL